MKNFTIFEVSSTERICWSVRVSSHPGPTGLLSLVHRPEECPVATIPTVGDVMVGA